jgi:hypothetical protein
MNLQETIRRILREELFDKKQNLQSDILTNFKNQDQEERNEYQKFVHSEFNGDYERAAKEYAKLKNRSFDDIFGDKERMEKFISIDFDFDGLSDEDWENYWLLSQHADTNPNFQKDALKTISQYLGKDNDNYKYLHDRISCRETGTQKYGTQNICKKYSLDNLQESIRRILREELSPRVRRRIDPDEMEKEFLESFDYAYKIKKRAEVLPTDFLDELIYSTITILLDGLHWNFVTTLPEDEFWYDDIHKELENHYRDRITQMYNERDGINESILREELHSPAGDKYRPGRYVVHKSSPHWRENIELTGLQTSVGDCYQVYAGGDVKCKKAIFATDSLNEKDMFDSTYDDDIWIIDTECAGVSWFKDKHYFKQGDNNYHIVTFKNISPDCLELIHEGTGKSYS